MSASVADMLLGAGANDGLSFGLHTLVMAMAMPGVTKLRVASLFVMPVRGCTEPSDPGPDTDDKDLDAEAADNLPVLDVACSFRPEDLKHLWGAAGSAIGL